MFKRSYICYYIICIKTTVKKIADKKQSVGVSFLIKLRALHLQLYQKIESVFSCEFCKIFKSTFYRTPQGNCFLITAVKIFEPVRNQAAYICKSLMSQVPTKKSDLSDSEVASRAVVCINCSSKPFIFTDEGNR